MKGFMLDSNGDIVISNNEIQMVNGTDLTAQTVKTVLSTNKGEWIFDKDEGINFTNILGKKFTEPKTASDKAYVDKIASLTAQARATEQATDELNELLERRLDGDS